MNNKKKIRKENLQKSILGGGSLGHVSTYIFYYSNFNSRDNQHFDTWQPRMGNQKRRRGSGRDPRSLVDSGLRSWRRSSTIKLFILIFFLHLFYLLLMRNHYKRSNKYFMEILVNGSSAIPIGEFFVYANVSGVVYTISMTIALL